MNIGGGRATSWDVCSYVGRKERGRLVGRRAVILSFGLSVPTETLRRRGRGNLNTSFDVRRGDDQEKCRTAHLQSTPHKAWEVKCETFVNFIKTSWHLWYTEFLLGDAYCTWNIQHKEDTCLPVGAQSTHRTRVCLLKRSHHTGHLSVCWSAVITQDTCLPVGAQSSHRTPVCLLERSHHTGHVSACLRNSEKPNWSNWPLQKNRLCLETTDVRTGCGMMMNQRHAHMSKSKSVGLKFGKCRTVHRQYESFPTIGRAKFIQTHRSTWCAVVAARFVTK
jgi:hypothetical protein